MALTDANGELPLSGTLVHNGSVEGDVDIHANTGPGIYYAYYRSYEDFTNDDRGVWLVAR